MKPRRRVTLQKRQKEVVGDKGALQAKGEHILRRRCEIWPRRGLLSTGDDHIPSEHFKIAFFRGADLRASTLFFCHQCIDPSQPRQDEIPLFSEDTYSTALSVASRDRKKNHY